MQSLPDKGFIVPAIEASLTWWSLSLQCRCFLPGQMNYRRIGMNRRVLMYSLAGYPKTFAWLVAAAIAVQPVTGFSCGCGGACAGTGAQSFSKKCCCCCSAQRSCRCCGAACHSASFSRPQRTCCQKGADRDRAPANDSTCKCKSGNPAEPQSVPTQRSPADDLTTSSLVAHVATADVLAVHQAGWAINLPTEFASASEHCIALCRLRF